MTKMLRIGGVPEHFNLPWHMALEDNAFSETGVHLQYQEVAAGTGELSRQLRDNELDIALLLTEGAVSDIVQHDLNRLVKVYAKSPLIWGIHVAAQSNIKRVADMRGKRVAISRFGSGSHLIAIVDAAMRGWPTQDMQFVVVENMHGARKALADGDADIFLWERYITQPLVDAGEFRRVAQREVPWPAFVVSVRRDILVTHGKKIREVLDIAGRYADNFRRRKTAPKLIADTYGMRLIDAEAWLSTVRFGQSYRRPDTALNRVANALYSQGVIDSNRVDPASLWYNL